MTKQDLLEYGEKLEIDKNLEKVIQAADVVCWAHACNSAKKKGRKNPCDLKGAIEDLTNAMEKLELSRYVIIESKLRGGGE